MMKKRGNLKDWLAWWLVVREQLNVDCSWWLFIFNLCMFGGGFWKRRLLGSMLLLSGGNAAIKGVGTVVVYVWWGVLILIPHFFPCTFGPLIHIFFFLFVCISIFFLKKATTTLTQWEELINDFEMCTLIVERVESKFLDFKLFWKDVKNVENNTNTSRTYFFNF